MCHIRRRLLCLLCIGFLGAAPALHAQSPSVTGSAGGAAAAPDAAPLRRLGTVLTFSRLIAMTGAEKAPALQEVSLAIADQGVALIAAVTEATGERTRPLDQAHADKAELLLTSFDNQFEHEYLDMQIGAHREALALAKSLAGAAAPMPHKGLGERVTAALGGTLARLEDAKRQLPAM